MKKNKKTVITALSIFAAMAAPSLAAEPAQPPSEQAAPIEDADPAPGDSVANPDDKPGASGAAGESAGNNTKPAKEYRHRPGACPEGPPCKSE